MNDDRLRQLLSDAVSDIEPEDRIEELRATVRPSPRVVGAIHARPWYAAAAIVAAVIGVVAYVTSVAGDDSSQPGFANRGGSSVPTVIATDTSGPTPSAQPAATRLTVYYLGHGPNGDVLYRESVAAGDDPMHTAVSALNAIPLDPDYRTGWLVGSIISAELRHGVIQVELGAMHAHRPHGMSARTASEIIQQAVYTFESASGHRTARVQFLRDHRPAHTVLGVPTGHPVPPARATAVLSLMSLSSPQEGQAIERGPFVVTGMNNGPEGTVEVKVVRKTPTGNTTVLTRAGTATGYGDQSRLYSWRVAIDTSGLPPGRYTVVASNQGLPGGTEGQGAATDTRSIVLR